MINPAPKPNFPRRKPKRGNLTRITSKVRKEVLERSGGFCERCGRNRTTIMEMAHLQQAGQLGKGNDPANIVLLCGPSTVSNTCHNFADSTAKGREWRMAKRKELIDFYGRESR